MKHITFAGNELKIAFNLATEIAYEDITGKPFSIADVIYVDDKGNSTQNEKAFVYVAISSVIANNQDSDVDADTILLNENKDEVENLMSTVAHEMLAWFKITPIAEEHVPAPEEIPEEEKKA